MVQYPRPPPRLPTSQDAQSVKSSQKKLQAAWGLQRRRAARGCHQARPAPIGSGASMLARHQTMAAGAAAAIVVIGVVAFMRLVSRPRRLGTASPQSSEQQSRGESSAMASDVAPGAGSTTSEARERPSPVESKMLVLLSAPLTHIRTDEREAVVPALDQERELNALADSLRKANRILYVQAITARTDELAACLTLHPRPVLLHFSGHV